MKRGFGMMESQNRAVNVNACSTISSFQYSPGIEVSMSFPDQKNPVQ